MVMTGGGAGSCRRVMKVLGAVIWLEHSLPFEQEANPIMAGDPKLLQYFFTRKLFLEKVMP